MNDSYYRSLQDGLRRVYGSIPPDLLIAQEQESLRGKIQTLCQLAAVQIEEIAKYESRHRLTE